MPSGKIPSPAEKESRTPAAMRCFLVAGAGRGPEGIRRRYLGGNVVSHLLIVSRKPRHVVANIARGRRDRAIFMPWMPWTEQSSPSWSGTGG